MANKNEIAKGLHKVISETLENHQKEQADLLAKKEEELRKGFLDSAKSAVSNVWAGIKESLASDHARFGHLLPSQETTAPSQRLQNEVTAPSARNEATAPIGGEFTQKVVGGSAEVTQKVSPSQAVAGQKAPAAPEVTPTLPNQQILSQQWQKDANVGAANEKTIEQTINDAPSPSVTSGTDAPASRHTNTGRVILPSTHAAIVDRAFAHPVSDIADAAALSSAGAQKRSLGVPVVSEQRGAHGIQPTAKAEMLIDLKNANDPWKRVKVINDKGTVVPGDKKIAEPVKSDGNGGKIKAAPLSKADDPFKQRAPPIAHKHCPRCGSTRAHPVGSVNQGGKVKESWICDNCNHQWITDMAKSVDEVNDLIKSDIENDFAGLSKAEKTLEVSDSQIVGSSSSSGKKQHRVGAKDSHTSEKTVDENTKQLKDSTILRQQKAKDSAENKKNYGFVNKLRGMMGQKKKLNVNKAEATAPYAAAPMMEHNAQKTVAPAPKSSMIKAEPPVAKPPPAKDSHGAGITHTAGKSSTPGQSSKNTIAAGGPNTAAAASSAVKGMLNNPAKALPKLPVMKAEGDASKPAAPKPSIDERMANVKTKLAEADKIAAGTAAKKPIQFTKAEELCKEKECGEMEKAALVPSRETEFSPTTLAHTSSPAGSPIKSAVPKVAPANFDGSEIARRSSSPVVDSPKVTGKPQPQNFEQFSGPSGLELDTPAPKPVGGHNLYSKVPHSSFGKVGGSSVGRFGKSEDWIKSEKCVFCKKPEHSGECK